MSTTRILLLSASILAASLLRAQDQSYSQCLTKVKSEWGKPCERCEDYKEGWKRSFEETYKLELKNTCGDMVEVKVAVQEKGGTWRTFPIKALAGGQSMEVFACHGTGKYLYWVRKVNDTEIILPSDQEILTEYRQ
ncbi:MAG: hypothetical protein IPI55_15510 [Flavobacteriales bacterium]|nr:hypothetical protein [Flavobacteriales bacterium]